jgi:phosphatidylserine/phosphatidylglycerophosphate/cardiolipin synthase-like enzyme
MTTFLTPIAHGAGLQRLVPSAAAPALRYKDDPLMWIGVPAGVAIKAFATGSIAQAQGTSGGVPGNAAASWTLFQLSPLPQMKPAAFKPIPGGLPLQLVIVIGSVAAPASDELLVAGATLTTAPTGAGSTAFMTIAFQDRLCRDPLTWAEAIAASGDCDTGWSQFIADLAALPSARHLRVLDARGLPLAQGSVRISIDGGPGTNVPLTGTDGDTGIIVPAASRATVVASSAAHPIVAAGDSDAGAFEGTGLQLAPGARMAQILDADQWLAAPDDGVQIQRWNPNSFLEPIQEGDSYFPRLVADVRLAKPGGAVEFAGWGFVKGSLSDSKVDWELVPGDPNTTFIELVKELRNNQVDVRMLVNQFLVFDSDTLDDFPQLLPIVFSLYASLSPVQVLLKMQTDPAGYVVGMLALQAMIIVMASPLPEAVVRSLVEYSIDMMDALQAIDPTIATWTPYPASLRDNPLVLPPPFKILGNILDDISHIGVYHQKYVNILTSDGKHIAYLGGIDINSDRLDTSLHRAVHPFHDVQVKVTGPAVADVIRSYAERATYHNAPISIPIPDAGTIHQTGSHLVQIARTYFKAEPGSLTTPFSFAPNGESTSVRSIIAAIRQARDYIYIEDQYFTPPDDYINELLAAASRGVRALMITTPYVADVPYGGERRADVLNALSNAWGDRLYTGAPLRRFLHEVPGLTTNLGRMRLATKLDEGDSQCDLSPLSHIPAPPFWAFIGNELVLVHAPMGGPSGTGSSAKQTVEILRAGSAPPAWGAEPVDHPVGAPVLAVQVPGIYVHAKVMIVDDVFLFAGSTNINRRGFYHDGEMNSFSIPQHLKGDPANPARVLRSRLMAEHAGLPAEIGDALFADPISSIPYFTSRLWYEGSHRQPLNFFGSPPPDVPLGTADSVFGWVLGLLIGHLREDAKPDVWPLLVDPTTALDPSNQKGPGYP